MSALPRDGHRRERMSWLDRLLPADPTPEIERRERETDSAMSEISDFVRGLQEKVQAFQDTANEDRLDYPVASAMRKRRARG